MADAVTAYYHPSGRWTLTSPDRWNEPPLEWILTRAEVEEFGKQSLEVIRNGAR